MEAVYFREICCSERRRNIVVAVLCVYNAVLFCYLSWCNSRPVCTAWPTMENDLRLVCAALELNFKISVLFDNWAVKAAAFLSCGKCDSLTPAWCLCRACEDNSFLFVTYLACGRDNLCLYNLAASCTLSMLWAIFCRSSRLVDYPCAFAVTCRRDSFSVPVSASTSVNSLALCCASSFLCYLCGVAVSVWWLNILDSECKCICASVWECVCKCVITICKRLEPAFVEHYLTSVCGII